MALHTVHTRERDDQEIHEGFIAMLDGVLAVEAILTTLTTQGMLEGPKTGQPFNPEEYEEHQRGFHMLWLAAGKLQETKATAEKVCV